MGYTAVTNTFVNGTTAVATDVNQDFADIVNGLSDGTKDLNMSSISGVTLTISGASLFKTGTAAAPSIAGSAFTTTGIFWAAGPTFSIAVSGTSYFEIATTTAVYRGATLLCQATGAGTTQSIQVINQSNTASAAAYLVAQVAGTSSTGNALFQSIISGVTTWAMGSDTANGNRFSIANNSNVGSSDYLSITTTGSVLLNNAALATNATNGFLYIAACAGAATGAATAVTGRIPVVFDSTNFKLYANFAGSWKSVLLS